MTSSQLQQWQMYNPLDKSTSVSNKHRSNKLPFSKKDAETTVNILHHPKVSSVGVCPLRQSGEVENLKVMMVGSSVKKDQGFVQAEKIEEVEEVQKLSEDGCDVKLNQPAEKSVRPKMPAIIATEGTTMQAQFTRRAKPPQMPRSLYQTKRKVKPVVLDPSNISPGKQNMPSTIPFSDGKSVIRKGHSRVGSSAPRSSPIDEVVLSPVEVPPAAVRSIDDMIQTLRSSRNASGKKPKSASDKKIDEILLQVRTHAEQWIGEVPSFTLEHQNDPSDDGSEISMIIKQTENLLVDSITSNQKKSKEDSKAVTLKDNVEEVELSDTISTITSLISLNAGFPDISSILARESTHDMRRSVSDTSTSSPLAMMQTDEEMWDYEQAIRDLNMPLDVKNDDILNVTGGHPPLLEKPVSRLSFQKGRHVEQDRMPVVNHGGKNIHRLCFLPSIKELSVKPKEFALSKILHTSDDPLHPPHADYFNVPLPSLESNLPLKLISESSSNTLSVTKNLQPIDDRSRLLDTSKIDPLDIDSWRRVVEGEFQKTDYCIRGTSDFNGTDWGLWRMMWTVAPPKMSLSTSAVKALVFPQYHGTKLTTIVDVKEESYYEEDGLSEIFVEDEDKHVFYEKTILRKHKSMENLSCIPILEHRESVTRTLSNPNIAAIYSDQNSSTNYLVKTDYMTGLAEVKLQRGLVLQQQQKQSEEAIQHSGAEDPKAILEDIVTKGSTQDESTKYHSNFSKTSLTPQTSKSLVAQAKEAGRSYVVYNRKKSVSNKGRKFIRNIRKSIIAYKPLMLLRSQSTLSFFPISYNIHSLSSMPNLTKSSPSCRQLHGKIKRSTSTPDISDFKWFISRHQKYGELIEDMREWVRDIWNEWFDEVFPPETDEESSFYESESLGEDEVDDHEKVLEEKKKKAIVVIPDVVPFRLASTLDTEDDTEKSIRDNISAITDQLDSLQDSHTSQRACHLARRGALLRIIGEIKRAAEDLDEAISLEPLLVQAYWQRHLIRLLKHQQHEALDDLNALLKIDKTSVDAYRSRADIYAALGDYTMAIVNYSQAIKLIPNDEEAYLQRALFFEKTGDLLLAVEDYTNVINLNPTRTDALRKRASFYIRKNSWLSAIADYTRILELEPLSAEARTFRAKAYAATGKFAKALTDLSAAVHLDPLNASAFFHRGALLRTAAPNKALQDLSISMLLDDSEKNVLAVLHRGILYNEMKRYQEAIADFEQTLRLDQSMACAHVNIGLIHLQVTCNFWEAIKRFTLAIKGDPTYARSYVCRSDAFARIRDFKSAVRDITRAIHLQPEERHLYLRRGQHLLQLKKLKLASFCVKHVATMDKGFVTSSATQEAIVQSFLGNHEAAVNSLFSACRTKPVPHMYVLLAKALMKAKRFKEAITHLKNAIELCTLYTFGDTNKHDKGTPKEAAQMHFLLGLCNTELLHYSEALVAYNHALKVNPNFAEAYYQRGLCRLKQDQSKGVQDLNRALALQPDLFEAYLSRAAFYSTKQRYSKAILNCNEALQLRPRSVRALLCRGALKFQINAHHHAINDLTEAIDMDKRCSLAYYNRAVCYHKTKAYSKALKDYSIVLTLTESQSDEATKSLRGKVFVNRALLYLQGDLNDPRNAALDLEEASLLTPNNTNILHTMALCYHKLNDLTEAKAAYSRCINIDPYFLAAYVGRGAAYEDAGKLAKAKAEYQRALKLDPTCVGARVHLGYNLQMSGLLQQAWLQFTAAIQLDPKSQSALEGRAVTCLHAGDLYAASCDISVALERGRPSARLLTARGVVYQSQRDFHTAMAYYNKARDLDPSYAPASFNAAVLYMRDRRFAVALERLEVVLDQNPCDSAAILNRAITRVFLNQPQAALSDFDRALELDPTNSHILYNRANLYYGLKQYEASEADFTAALEINPSDYMILKRRADVRGCLGKKKDAIEDYRQSLAIHEKYRRLQQLKPKI